MTQPDVLILAAGRGERMRPLTDDTPKPLLRVGGHALIEHHLVQLQAQGFRNVVINLAHLGERIRAHLGDGARFGLHIRYSDEQHFDGDPTPLNTGGGIAYALALLSSDPFVVINSDILCDFDYARLRVPARRAMHLVLVDNPPHNARGDFALRDAADASGITHGELALPTDEADRACTWTYAGIAAFRRSAFDGIVPGRFPLLPLIERATAAGAASGEIHRGRWLDVGTPERLRDADAGALPPHP